MFVLMGMPGGGWQLLQIDVAAGVASPVGLIGPTDLAQRVCVLLGRHGLDDQPWPDDIQTRVYGAPPQDLGAVEPVRWSA